ncbi:hypothetical protein L7F22_033952 [Adiantum nelumboides]|nr:hypothetical protein [Adiantum nelumboides]
MSKPWAIGDWAAEAERAEEEEKARAAAAAAAPPDDVCSGRSESLSGKSRRKKQTFSISEFTTGRSVSHGTRTRDTTTYQGFTPPQGMRKLPTGRQDRSAERDQYIGLGGAFQDHREGGVHRGASDRFGGEFGYDRRPENDRIVSGPFDRVSIEPSRADGSSDWSSSKRVIVPRAGGYGGERKPLPDGEKRGPQQGQSELVPSRADGVENWGLVKRSLTLAPAKARPARRSDDSRQLLRADEAGSWTTFRTTLSPRMTEATHSHSRADQAANWLSMKTMSISLRDQESRPAGDQARTMQRHQQAAEDLWRKPAVSTQQTQPCSSSPRKVTNADVTSTLPPLGPKPKSNPFGFARPREEILANKDPVDQNQIGTKQQESGPSSSLSCRSCTPEISGEPAVKPRSKVNPFGDAKPREVLLQERGKDWRRMDFDLEHRAVERSETQEEIALREEIRVLTELSMQAKESFCQRTNGYALDPSVRQDSSLHVELHNKERRLQELTMALDDKVRFSQKTGGRAGSQAGWVDIGRRSEVTDRSGSHPSSRPGSRSGRSDTSGDYDSRERLEPRRTFDASDHIYSLSEYGARAGSGQARNLRESTPAPEKMGSWSGHKVTRGSKPSERQDWHVVPELSAAVKYSQQAGGQDVWTRSNDGIHEKSTGWRQERGHYKGGERRF